MIMNQTASMSSRKPAKRNGKARKTTTLETIEYNRERYKVRYGDLLPPLAPADFEALKADIVERGVQVPIVVTTRTT